MVEQVDAGPIIDVALFADSGRISVVGAGRIGLCSPGAVVLADGESAGDGSGATATAADPVGCQKYSRRAYRAICDIPLDIPKEELDRRIRVFGGNHFGISPTINLHGIEFRAVLPQGQTAA